MTIDHIAVERRYEGKWCDTLCRGRGLKGTCSYSRTRNGKNEKCVTTAEDDEYIRCPSCLAQPPAALLTDQMREAVDNVLAVACDRGDVTWVRSAEMDALRAAFVDAALAAAKEDR